MTEQTPKKPVEIIDSPIYMDYNFSAGRATAHFLRSIKDGKLVGQRSPITGKVIVPPRGSDPETGEATTEEVTLGDTATVISFTVVYIPIPNSAVQPPFVVANLVLDDSDQTFIHLVSGCKNEDVQIGTRVKAVWKDKSEWGYGLDNIAYFQPNGQAAIDIEQLKIKRLKETAIFRQKTKKENLKKESVHA